MKEDNLIEMETGENLHEYHLVCVMADLTSRNRVSLLTGREREISESSLAHNESKKDSKISDDMMRHE